MDLFETAFAIVSSPKAYPAMDPYEANIMVGLKRFFQAAFEMAFDDPEMGLERFWEKFERSKNISDEDKQNMDNLRMEVAQMLEIVKILITQAEKQ